MRQKIPHKRSITMRSNLTFITASGEPFNSSTGHSRRSSRYRLISSRLAVGRAITRSSRRPLEHLEAQGTLRLSGDVIKNLAVVTVSFHNYQHYSRAGFSLYLDRLAWSGC